MKKKSNKLPKRKLKELLTVENKGTARQFFRDSLKKKIELKVFPFLWVLI